MKKSLFSCFSVFFLFCLLFYPEISFEGAKNGLLLWFQTVIPTLFPFMVASKLAVLTGGSRWICKPFLPICSRLFGIHEDGTYTLFSGLLCGYPMGAKTCSDFLEENRISISEGRFLVALCNLPSPMFLLGYLFKEAGGMLTKGSILFCVYAPLLPLSFLAWYYYLRKEKRTSLKCSRLSHQMVSVSNFAYHISLEELLAECSQILVSIGGYMMLFSVMAAFVSHTKLPVLCKSLLIGGLEMTTGIHSTASLVSYPLSWACMIAFPVFGGLSGLFQTKSVMKNVGLSIRHYILWKVLHTVLSILSFLVINF